ncbi:Udp-glycosyltransferase 85a8 [Thalictrum thalictroides]|uniref:Glycosyltransferase n=1 Tax=Thalictrum thalictroides TaxID=46969 RepID=A0A7J6WL99_THATH|nr:Udp-glycosyltransferase 85a8 [Thalictrum thalictroides]
MGSNTEAKKPHAVCIPFPAQGHINPMIKLAKLLHHKGFHITFVNTEYNHKRLINSRGPDSVKGLPDFQFKTIPDGLPPSDANATQDIPSLCDSTSKTCLVPFRELITNLNNTANLPSVSCIVSDGSMSFTVKVAQELGIPEALFWTPSACGFMAYLQFPHLVQSCVIPFKDESYLTDEYLETVVHFADEIKDIRLRDLPSFIRTTDNNDIMINFFLVEIERTFKASAVILNTFDEFEIEVLNEMKSKLPPIYTIGPLHLIVNDQVVDNGLKSIESNLWKDERECLEWLDSKVANSVVYINFGSITVMTPEQMIEFAWGLANSNCNFLWVKRPDLIVSGDHSAVLPAEFIAQTKERGLLVRWCPQEQVLNHPSIGGFLTHSGWNSTIESVSSGVPMLCWPFFAEQQMNCRFACTHWGIGMEIDSNVKRDEVENLVRELMEGEKGQKMKMKAMEWKKKAIEATAPGGSSYVNIDKLINDCLLK